MTLVRWLGADKWHGRPQSKGHRHQNEGSVVQVYTFPDLVQFSSMVVQGSSPGGQNSVVALNKSAVKLTKIGNAGFMQQPLQDVGSTSREARQTPFLSHDTWSVNLVRGKVVLAVVRVNGASSQSAE
jgi:hypothetical protein